MGVLMQTIIALAILAVYCKILDKLGLKERTKQIAIIIPHAIIVICAVFYIAIPKIRYFSMWFFILWLCIGLIAALLEIYNKEQLVKKLKTLHRIVFWFGWIAMIVEMII